MKSIVSVVGILIAWLLPLSLYDVIPFRSVPAAFSAQKSSLIATEQEVREFFAQYIERYNKREIEEFLWLFSLKAKQNQQDGLPEIRVIYNDLFNRSRSLQLSLEDMKIEIYQNAVEVKARYSVNQVLKEGGRKKVWKGNAHWVLTKEEGKLQVLTVDYEYSIPPTLAGEKMPAPLPLLAKEEEVKQFFSNYVDRYQRKDIAGFLSFFSPKAVHNQRDRIEEIRGIYTQFFDESKALRFQVEGMKTEIYQNRVEVKARFRVEQTLKKGEKEIIWTGNIRWVLGSEDGALKIVSLDYQNDKSR
jgi:ketosteroid isomerase-like protein